MALRAPAREFAETRLRVGSVSWDEGARVPMRTGPWMLGLDGEQTVAALGVMIDDAAGMEVHRHRPPGAGSVTAELSVDVVVPPPWPGPELIARARLLGAGEADGTARCEVTAATGQVVAVATGRFRFVAAVGVVPPGSEGEPIPPAEHRDILDVLGIADLADALRLRPAADLALTAAARHTAGSHSPDGSVSDTGAGIANTVARLVVPPSPTWGNDGGSVHGGVLFAGSELAAAALAHETVEAAGAEPGQAAEQTTSIRMNFLRPAVLAEPLMFTASTCHRGRAVAVYRVTSHGPAGKPYTIATITRARAPRPHRRIARPRQPTA